jgi:dTDP-4-amino-4,6-dideoxygalactose transaminase
MSKLIAISLNPNVQKIDILKVLSAVPRFIVGQLRQSIEQFEINFAQRFGSEYKAVSFLTGRASWYALLSSLGLQKGDEILVPAFTCVAVINPIRWLGLKPVYVDVNENFLLDLHDAQKKLSRQTKVMLVQHTFGQTYALDEYVRFAQENNVLLIEDCAHAMGGTWQGTPLGTFGHAAFFSLGRDKCLSAGMGGIVITADPLLQQQLTQSQKQFPTPSAAEPLRYLFYVLSIELVYWLYGLHPTAGKLFHRLLLESGLIKRANSPQEKKGEYDSRVLQQWHPILAWLAQVQLNRIESFTNHRRELSEYYQQTLQNLPIFLPQANPEGAWLRYSVLVDDSDRLRQKAANQQMILGDWYDQPIGPRQVNLAAVEYQKGMCPQAEQLSARVVNLPTSPRTTREDAKKVVAFLSANLTSKSV